MQPAPSTLIGEPTGFSPRRFASRVVITESAAPVSSAIGYGPFPSKHIWTIGSTRLRYLKTSIGIVITPSAVVAPSSQPS